MSADKKRVLIEARGTTGQLELLEDRIRIKRGNVLGFLNHGFKGSKEILIHQISSVQFRNAGPLLNGYIQFAFLGGTEAQRGVWQATTDENTVVFSIGAQRQFEAIKEALDQKMAAPVAETRAVAEPRVVSSLDELEKLASFRDRGIISEEEFTAKKRQILGI